MADERQLPIHRVLPSVKEELLNTDNANEFCTTSGITLIRSMYHMVW